MTTIVIYTLGSLLVLALFLLCLVCLSVQKAKEDGVVKSRRLVHDMEQLQKELDKEKLNHGLLKDEREAVGNQLIDQAINNADLESEINDNRATIDAQSKSIQVLSIEKTRGDNKISDLQAQVSRLKLDVTDLLDPTKTRLTLPELIARCREDIKAT